MAKLLLALVSLLVLVASAFGQSLHGEEPLAPRDLYLSTESYCRSFQFNAEVKNLPKGWLVPLDCVSYMKRYTLKGQYAADLAAVVAEARAYVKSLTGLGSNKAWVFDIDETSLSNVPYYMTHSYGAEKYNSTEFNAWVNLARAPPIYPTLALFRELVADGWNVFFLTGRPESQRAVTVKNLRAAGYHGWSMLLLKSPSDNSLPNAQAYKTKVRERLVKGGYEILGNMGDQWSDISGNAAGARGFKLPNTLYFIP